MKQLSIVLPLFLSLLAACGTDDEAGEGSGTPIPVEESSELIASVLCEKLDECCEWSEFAETGVSDVASCETVFGGFFAENQADYEAALERGTVRYNAANTGTCLSQIRRRDCGTPILLETEECANVWTPLVADGESCLFDFECVSDLCAFSDEADTEGTCSNPRAGDPCAFVCSEFGGERSCFHTCPGDLSCNMTFEGSGESTNICGVQTYVGVGEDCSDAFCEDGSSCDYGGGTVCVADLEAGQTCTEDEDYLCESGSCVDGTCQAITACNSLF